MSISRNYIERKTYEDESINGMFLTILDNSDEVYGYCISKDRNYSTLYTYCYYKVESDSLRILENEVDLEFLQLAISSTEERLKMLDALRAYGYKWNFQKRQIEE
jgi:hypothetical protein